MFARLNAGGGAGWRCSWEETSRLAGERVHLGGDATGGGRDTAGDGVRHRHDRHPGRRGGHKHTHCGKRSPKLGSTIFLLFRALNKINAESVIGPDKHILLSVALPVILLTVEYIL